MAWLTVGIPLLAAWLFGFSEHPVLAWTSLGVALVAMGALWSEQRHAAASARSRRAALVKELRRDGKLDAGSEPDESSPLRLTAEDRKAVPAWLTAARMTATGAGVALLLWSLIV